MHDEIDILKNIKHDIYAVSVSISVCSFGFRVLHQIDSKLLTFRQSS